MFGKKVVDCFTSNPMAFKHASIDSANKFLPDWWRQLPKPKDDGFAPGSNMKLCRGFIDHYKNSFIIPMWSDLDIEVGPKGSGEWRYQFADEASELITHEPEQWGGLRNPSDIFHAKIMSPWHLRSKDSTMFMQTAPTYNIPVQLRGMEIMPGTIEFKQQSATHVIAMFDRPTHLISREELSRIETTRVSFVNSYGKVKKCPFNFS
jgi:hypothetical protein